MRISDWSSDVCSSDLEAPARQPRRRCRRHVYQIRRTPRGACRRRKDGSSACRSKGGQRGSDCGAYREGNRKCRPPNHDIVTQRATGGVRSEEHTSELQSLMRISYAVFCLKKKSTTRNHKHTGIKTNVP